jgi:hypothetical protein
VTRRTLFALLLVGVLGAFGAVRVSRRLRAAVPTSLVVTPTASELSARVGEPVVFSATTDAGADVTWSLWSHPVSHERTWSWVPAASDAGWQHVTLTVVRDGERLERMWDVGVVAPLPPALVELVPPAGPLALAAGERPRFRCGARAPAARPDDRLRFEWTLDGQPVHREDGPATAAFSELVLPVADAGPHRLAVRVGEGDGDAAAARAEWSLAVAAAPADVPPAPPPSRIVHPSGPRRLTGVVGERFAFAAEVPAAPPRTRWDWAVDGRRVQRGPAPRYEYAATAPGRHRVSVAVSAGRKSIGRDSWFVVVAPR